MSVEAVLRVLNGPQEGETRSLHSGQEIVVGRRADNPLSINDGYMSRNHFRVFATDSEVRVEDAGSSHGTLVNGSRIKGSVALGGSDVIRAGATEFQVSVVVSATPSGDSDWSSDLESPSPSKSRHAVPARTIQKSPSAVFPPPSPMDSGWDDLWDDSGAAAKQPAAEVKPPVAADEAAPTREQPVVQPDAAAQPELKPTPAAAEAPDWDIWDVPPAAQAPAPESLKEAQAAKSDVLPPPSIPAEEAPAPADDWDEPLAPVEAPSESLEAPPREVAAVETPRPAPLVSEDSWEAAWEDEPPSVPRGASESQDEEAPPVKAPAESEPISLVVEAPAKPVAEKAPPPLDDEWDDLPSSSESPEESPESPSASPAPAEQSADQKKPAPGKSAADLDWWPD